MNGSVHPSVCPSVGLWVCHTFFTMFSSSYHHEIWNELLPMTEIRSMQKVRGQRSRSQRSKPNFAVSGPQLQFKFTYGDEIMHKAWWLWLPTPFNCSILTPPYTQKKVERAVIITKTWWHGNLMSHWFGRFVLLMTNIYIASQECIRLCINKLCKKIKDNLKNGELIKLFTPSVLTGYFQLRNIIPILFQISFDEMVQVAEITSDGLQGLSYHT